MSLSSAFAFLWPEPNATLASRLPFVALVLMGYIAVCSSLRFKRVESLQKRLGFQARDSLSRITNTQARDIVYSAASYEFPLFYDLALRVALFRAVDVGRDLNKQTTAAKRYEDTEVIFTCLFKFAPDSVHLHKAVARMNFLHQSYIKSGKILNKDLLYVLYASMKEPVRFMRQYEWRSLTDMEVAALGQLWKYVGEMMEINYASELGKSDWKDGIDFMDDLEIWATKYEDDHMKALPEIKELGEVLLGLLLSSYPSFARPIGYQAVVTLLGERLRHSFGLPEPSIGTTTLVHAALCVRRFIVRYLMLPRMFGVDYLSDPDPKSGRMHKLRYLKEPWYNDATIWTRWNPVAIVTRLYGVQIPGDGGAEMKPEGLLFEDIGPKSKMGRGNEEVERLEELARNRVSGSCPFSA